MKTYLFLSIIITFFASLELRRVYHFIFWLVSVEFTVIIPWENICFGPSFKSSSRHVIDLHYSFRYLAFLSASLSPRFFPLSISSFSIGKWFLHKVTFITNKWDFNMEIEAAHPICPNLSLLLRRECCTFSNGEYVKSGLAVLEKWISDSTEEVSIIYPLCSWHITD